MSKNLFRFDFQSVTTIAETKKGRAIVKGTLLTEGVSRNGNLYTIQEMKSIAQRTVGKPIYFGVTTRINPNTGVLSKNMHDIRPENEIGKILKTIWSRTKGLIKFVAEVWNTKFHPNIVSKIKDGWGISIDGFVTSARRTFDKLLRRTILRIQNLHVNHVQLVAPSVVRGQKEAKVESVKIAEAMVFRSLTSNEILSPAQLATIVLDELGVFPNV